MIETGIFSELFGFVVADPISLDRFHERPTLGLDLLDLYTRTDDGEQVAEAGAAIPISGVPEGYYSVAFREATASTLLQGRPLGHSTGWILHVVSGSVAVCGIGYLSQWNPNRKSVRHVALSPGWYQVDVRLGESINSDDFLLEIVLTPSERKPRFTADVTKRLFEEEGTNGPVA